MPVKVTQKWRGPQFLTQVRQAARDTTKEGSQMLEDRARDKVEASADMTRNFVDTHIYYESLVGFSSETKSSKLGRAKANMEATRMVNTGSVGEDRYGDAPPGMPRMVGSRWFNTKYEKLPEHYQPINNKMSIGGPTSDNYYAVLTSLAKYGGNDPGGPAIQFPNRRREKPLSNEERGKLGIPDIPDVSPAGMGEAEPERGIEAIHHVIGNTAEEVQPQIIKNLLTRLRAIH